MASRLVAATDLPLTPVTRQRVIYADTDRMGVVYHATYLRFLEHARVEHIRSMGFAYADMERMGYGLPVIDLAVTYLASAIYDDVVTVHVAMAKLTPARIHFVYRLTVEAGDRHDFHGVGGRAGEPGEALELVRAETRHACITLDDGRAARIPDPIFDMLERHWDERARSRQDRTS
ncbi:MAG: acyl-CoA thioesterase [Myxococcales bacterium]|nr:acyl-CoA thioesterase [Myxococcales bacterium]